MMGEAAETRAASTVIEDVARAIMETRGGCDVTDWREAEWNPAIAQALKEARAAIEAIRDLPPDVQIAGLNAVAQSEEPWLNKLRYMGDMTAWLAVRITIGHSRTYSAWYGAVIDTILDEGISEAGGGANVGE